MNILVTGVTGFVCKSLIPELIAQGHNITLISRQANHNLYGCKTIVCDLNNHLSFGDAISSTDVLIHLAGRAHVLNETSQNPYQTYAEINVNATKNLANLAAKNGVKRFIFLSSVKVNGEETTEFAFNENNSPKPEDDYGKTKLEAESVLAKLSENSDMEVVIIRPPLIYGKGVKANFKNLIKLCALKLPLPFGAIHNKRSMIYIENLIDFIILCINHPKAADEIFLISDDEDVSTNKLIRTIRKSFGMPSLLVPIPQSWLVFFLSVIGKKNLAKRLCGNLQVDISKAKNLLGWKPPFTFEQGIQRTIKDN